MNFSGFGYGFGNNYKDFVLKRMDFFVLCVPPSDVTDFHHVPVFQIVTDALHNFFSFPCKHLYFMCHFYVQPSWSIVVLSACTVTAPNLWLVLGAVPWILLLLCNFRVRVIMTARSSQEEGVPQVSASHDRLILFLSYLLLSHTFLIATELWSNTFLKTV